MSRLASSIRVVICLLLTLPAIVRANDSDGDIVVRLATEGRLLPLFLSEIEAESTAFPKFYLQQLENVLRFDLDNNGSTRVVAASTDVNRFVHGRSFDSAKYRNGWPGPEVFYLVRTKVENKTLKARVVSMTGQTARGLDLDLTGDIAKDRRTIHELADQVHLTLFGKPGVASLRFLYTVRTKNPRAKGPEWMSEVWEADWDGHNAVQLTDEDSYCVTPSYMPAKEGYQPGHFFFVSYKTGQPKVYIGSLKGGPSRRFSYIRGNQLMPAMPATRDRVAFICDAAGNPDLYLQRFSPEAGPMGKPYQIFASVRGTQASPSFSPDGSKVAFVSNKDGTPHIYVMDVPRPGAKLKNIRPRRITGLNRENTAPSWSPDGMKIAYSAKTDGVRQIWVYDFHAGKEKQLTDGPGHKENPTWAPNSLHLIFNSADADSSELYLVNLNQPKAVQISSGAGEKRFPCWQPRTQ